MQDESGWKLFESFEQPWTVPPTPELSDQLAYERRRLLAALAESELGTTESKVAHILQQYPETRDNPTSLAVRFWYRHQPDVIEGWGSPLHLDVLHELVPFETISRLGRHIQNTLGLFVGTPRSRENRDKLQIEFHRYLAERKDGDPEIRVYVDETGNNTQERYIGVAGVCVIDWRQYEMHHAALANWRQARLPPNTIHFTEADEQMCVSAMQLLQRVKRGGLLFIGHDMMGRTAGPMALVAITCQLVAEAVGELKRSGCLTRPTAIRVIKEAAAGFDRAYGPVLKEELERHLAIAFPNMVYVREVDAVPKGREVLLEIADLLAGSMQRRARFNEQNPRDRLAAAVFNVVGFQDPREKGVMVRGFTSQDT